MRIVKYLLAAVVALALGGVGVVYLAPESATRWIIDAQRSGAGLVRKEIALADGRHYAYLEGGQGAPLMLVHGFGANKDAFAPVAAMLTAHYHVVIPDLLGFGESDHPQDADYTAAAQAERMHALAQVLGLKSLHLGGSSMGGHIALLYAARYPAEVQSLWLLDSGGIWSAPPSALQQRMAQSEDRPIFVRSGDDLARAMTIYMNEPPFMPRPIVNVLAEERIRNYALEQRIFQQIMGDSIEARVKGLATPTLIVWGREDRALNPATAEILHQLLPHSAVVLMPGVGHLPMLERPKQAGADYLKFRAGLGA